MSRPTKKLRFSQSSSYHDFIPSVHEEYHDVHMREGRLLNVGGATIPALVSRVVQRSDDVWKSTESWKPVDDPEFALDPDGAWYDETVEQPVMQEGCPSVDGSGQRGKKLKSKVSVSLSYPFSRVY
jgi:hypothetical protein